MNKYWSTKKLGDCLAQFDRGISWSRKDEGGTIAVLRIPNIQEGHINLDDLKYIDPKNGNGELDKNDIVMVASNGNPDLVGRSALVTKEEKGMRFASFLVRLRLDDARLLSHYAHLFLLTPTFKRELRRKIATTSGIYNLRKEHIEKIKIPLPPLQIQKQIVERMDKIAEARKLNDELIQKSAELFQSLLHKELNPDGKNWEVKKLVEVADFLDNLRRPVTASDRVSGPYPYYGANGQQDSVSDYIFDDELVLLAEDGGYFGSKNRPVAYRVSGKCWVNNHAHVLKNKDEISDIDFLGYSLMYYDVTTYITGSTRAKLNKSAAEKIKIPIPSLEAQKQIVAKLSAVQEYKKQLLEQKSKLKELFDSVLHKSMNGGLIN